MSKMRCTRQETETAQSDTTPLSSLSRLIFHQRLNCLSLTTLFMLRPAARYCAHGSESVCMLCHGG